MEQISITIINSNTDGVEEEQSTKEILLKILQVVSEINDKIK